MGGYNDAHLIAWGLRFTTLKGLTILIKSFYLIIAD